MTSEVEICNLALTRLGHLPITALNEGTKPADRCALHYPMCRDALLRAHPWNFSIRRATLALDAVTPNHEYSHRHTLPNKCLKVIRTEWEAGGASSSSVYGFPGVHGYDAEAAPYRIEGRYLLCNSEVARIEYIEKVTDPNQFDVLFVDVLAQRLAAELAVAFTDTQSMAKSMWEIYQSKLMEARSTDAQEGTPRSVVDLSPWVVARG